MIVNNLFRVRRYRNVFISCILLSLLALLVMFCSMNTYFSDTPSPSCCDHDRINISIVICGRKNYEMGMITLKSVLIFSNYSINFVIMTENELIASITKTLQDYQVYRKNFTFEFHLVDFPESNGIGWRKLFKNCASQRLFLPSLLKHIDALLYIDTDVLFLSPVEQLWSSTFDRMNSSQLVAMANEGEDFSTNWYYRFSSHPYYGYYGLNSGVMFMNLTRMRQFHWNDRIEPIYLSYEKNIVWGDQDILNILLHEHPDRMYLIPCSYNYRPDHCIYSSTCKMIHTNETIKMVHGNRNVFFNDKCPEFKAIYRAFHKFELSQHSIRVLQHIMRHEFDSIQHKSNCHKIVDIFIDSLRL